MNWGTLRADCWSGRAVENKVSSIERSEQICMTKAIPTTNHGDEIVIISSDEKMEWNLIPVRCMNTYRLSISLMCLLLAVLFVPGSSPVPFSVRHRV
jgi:hypothetical protein